MPYTRHLARRGSYAIRYEGSLAGRVRLARVGGDARWIWTIFINRHVPRVPGVPISGAAVTLDEAASQFKQSHEAMRTKARLPKPQVAP